MKYDVPNNNSVAQKILTCDHLFQSEILSLFDFLILKNT